MRIISGKFKGKRVPSYGKLEARPTTDFAKEGLFNVLNNLVDFEELTALDLFSGTGSISFELISRGTPSVIAVEQNEKHCGYIRNIARELTVNELIIQRMDVFRFISSCKIKFNFIFADPPYQLPTISSLPDLIFEKGLLVENGLFVLEHSGKQFFESHPRFYLHRKYGNVNFTLFSQQPE